MDRWLVGVLLSLTAVAAQAVEVSAEETRRREQLAVERASVQARYDAAVRECQKAFAVTGCINGAKSERRTALLMDTNLSGLPPAIVVTGECDPIRDWGERYANRLRDARVQVTVTRYPGMYHGFLMRSDATARGRLAIAEVGALLSAKFTHPLTFQNIPITGHGQSENR